MILDTTSKTIEIVLSGVKTTNDCEYTADYADTLSGSTFVPVGNLGLTNGTSAVTPVPAPTSGIQRHVKALTVYNADTVNSTVTVRMYDGTNRRILIKVTLTPGQTLVFSPEAGWAVMASTNGQIPGTATNDNAAAGNSGEYIKGTVLVGSAFGLTYSAQTNITSVSLSAGDWDVWGCVGYSTSAGTPSILELDASLSGTSSAIDTSEPCRFTQLVYPGGQAVFSVNNVVVNVGPTRFLLAAAATAYLVGRASGSSGTTTGYGQIQARRRR